MKLYLSLIALFLLPVMSLAKYVAVLETLADPAAKDVVTMSDRTYLTDVLRSEAVKVLPAEQNYTIMTRENISAMLPPGKSIEDCEGSCLAETGRNIAADYVAQARVGMFGGSLTLSVEIYETAGNKLIAGFNGDGETVKDLLVIVKDNAPAFFKKVKGGQTGFDGVGGIANVSSGGNFSFQGSQKFIVEIVTNPAGALPTVDGKGFPKCTSTPCKVQLEAGEHRFVASMDGFEDAEAVVAVTSNNQEILLEMKSNFGYLDLRPGLQKKVGQPRDLKISVDGNSVPLGKVTLTPGMHSVSIKHPCYDPVEFNVAIQKQKTEVFDANLNRGKGGLVLDVEMDGEPQAVPVYIDGNQVGSTPFEGEVPICAEVSVGSANSREIVAVDLLWHEVVKTTHRLKATPMVESESDKTRARARKAFSELDDDDEDLKVAKPIPSSAKPANQRKIHWLPVGISAAAIVAGSALAVVGYNKATTAHDTAPTNVGEYRKNKDDIHSGNTLNTAGIVMAVVGAVGLGLSFAF